MDALGKLLRGRCRRARPMRVGGVEVGKGELEGGRVKHLYFCLYFLYNPYSVKLAISSPYFSRSRD